MGERTWGTCNLGARSLARREATVLGFLLRLPVYESVTERDGERDTIGIPILYIAHTFDCFRRFLSLSALLRARLSLK